MKDERDMVLIRYLVCLDLLRESNADIILLEKDLMVLEGESHGRSIELLNKT